MVNAELTRPRVLWWGGAPPPSTELELKAVLDLATLLERLREESFDLVVLADAKTPLLPAANLMIEADPGTVLLVVRAQIEANDREALHQRVPFFRCEPEELSPGLLAAIAGRAQALRSVERRANATEAALRGARRWREETEARLRDLFHELRTPVAVSLGWCANLADGIEGPLQETQKLAVGRARSALETMGQLLESGPTLPAMSDAVGALLDVERAREQRRRRIRLDDLASEIVGMLELEAGRKKVRLELKTAPELLPIWGERVRLAQLFMNVLGNAMRHARSRITISIERATGPEAERQIHISVEDDGRGFDPSLVSRVFERGTSGDQRSGLGLSIVKEITREHGGSCDAQNLEGGGASVQVWLPIDPRTRARPPIEVLALSEELLLEQLVPALSEPDTTSFAILDEVESLLSALRISGGRIVVSAAVGRRIEAALGRSEARGRGAS